MRALTSLFRPAVGLPIMAAVACLFALSASAQDAWRPTVTPARTNTCKPNGCGPSGWLGTLVPNAVSSCTFLHACNNHDLCYSRCEDCGDLLGDAQCEGSCEQKRVRKESCDKALETDIVKANADRSDCRLIARAYYYAVSFFGCSHFRGFNRSRQSGDIPRISRERFQQNFEAALKMLQQARRDPGSIDLKEIEQGIIELSRQEAAEGNRLHFNEGAAHPLALVSERRTRNLTKRRADQPPKIYYGIDITEANLGAATLAPQR